MWYDRAVKAYTDYETGARKRRAQILKEGFMDCFGESIDPVCGVYQLEYKGKQLVFYVSGGVLFAAYHRLDNWWFISRPMLGATTAGSQLLSVNHWEYPKDFPMELFGDLMWAYPEYKTCYA